MDSPEVFVKEHTGADTKLHMVRASFKQKLFGAHFANGIEDYGMGIDAATIGSDAESMVDAMCEEMVRVQG